MTAGIYKITCLPTGKYYIGSSIDIHKRFISHKSNLRLNKHGNQHLQGSWNKYGSASHIFSVVEVVTDLSNLLNVEQQYLDSINDWSLVFNIRKDTARDYSVKVKGRNYYQQPNGKFCIIITRYSKQYSKSVDTEKEAINLVAALKSLNKEQFITFQGVTKPTPKNYNYSKTNKAYRVRVSGHKAYWCKTEDEAIAKVKELRST
jgi:group I intron endonuclease